MSLMVTEILAQLSPEDERTLISLPYRAGLYVSFCDVTGGWEAQDREIQSLTSILQEFASDFYQTEFTQKILLETMAARGEWLSWARDVNALPDEATGMMKTLSAIMDDAEFQAFASVILDIALSVAMAFREQADEPATTHDKPGAIRQLIGRMMGGKADGDPFLHTNISERERGALKTLGSALGYRNL